MTSAQLKAFYAVARYGSFTAAAARLALSQPAISDHIRKLEETYGTALFVRAARGATLTEIGRKLFAMAERHAEAEAEAEILLSNAQNLEEGELTIGADAAVHIMPRIRNFRQKYPRIKLRILAGNSSDLVARLKDFSIDFAVAAILPDDPGIAALRISVGSLVAMVHAKSPLAKRKSVSLVEIAKSTIVLREAGSVTRNLAVAALHSKAITNFDSLEVEGREATQEVVAQGLGVALVSEHELTPDRRVAAIRLSDHSDKMQEWLLHLKSRSNLRLMRAFLHAMPNK